MRNQSDSPSEARHRWAAIFVHHLDPQVRLKLTHANAKPVQQTRATGRQAGLAAALTMSVVCITALQCAGGARVPLVSVQRIQQSDVMDAGAGHGVHAWVADDASAH
jgi:hypothetical protein